MSLMNTDVIQPETQCAMTQPKTGLRRWLHSLQFGRYLLVCVWTEV
jgi:hypothetical protein